MTAYFKVRHFLLQQIDSAIFVTGNAIILWLTWADPKGGGWWARPLFFTHREGHGAMVRARGFVNVVRFRIPSSAGFSEKYHVSPLSILGHCFNVVSLGKALNPQMLHLTQVEMSTW